jgi:hypothetical protein
MMRRMGVGSLRWEKWFEAMTIGGGGKEGWENVELWGVGDFWGGGKFV